MAMLGKAPKAKRPVTIPRIEARTDTAAGGPVSAYDSDFTLWAEDQAAALRAAAHAGTNLPVDWENVAEEIEALAKNQQRELASRIATIIEHLTKLQVSPASAPRAGWRSTIRQQRRELEHLFKSAPSLRSKVPLVIAEESRGASQAAIDDLFDRGEIDTADIELEPLTEEAVIGPGLPDL
jgi:hypothetical protein